MPASLRTAIVLAVVLTSLAFAQESTQYTISKQLEPLPAPGTRTSQLNRAFNAALGEFLAQEDGKRYDELYARHMGYEPRFRPAASDCDAWIDEKDVDASFRAILDRGTVRLGWSTAWPFAHEKDGELVGFDLDLGNALVEIIGRHYLGASHELEAEWVEAAAAATGDEQRNRLDALHRGLLAGDFDLALSGQMILPSPQLKGFDDIEWTAPTSILFTAISWTGRDADRLDVKALEALRGKDLSDFQAWAAAESKRLGLELRVFSVFNPGPSPPSAQGLVVAIDQQGGEAVWHVGDVPGSTRIMLEGVDHFAVGDSLASAAQSQLPGFKGMYLNIPANVELWPLAGFTLRKK